MTTPSTQPEKDPRPAPEEAEQPVSAGETPAPEAAAPEGAVPGYTPASPTARVWAWVGVVYMVIVMFLIVYWIATTSLLSGITSLMLFPATGGLAATGFVRAREVRLGKRIAVNKRTSASSQTALGVLWCIITAGLLGLGILELIAALGG